MKNSIFSKKEYVKWFIALIWIVIWSLAAFFAGSDLILPGPHSTLAALIGLLKTGSFYLNVLWTILRTVLGIVISFSLGALFAVLAFRNGIIREFLRLPVSFFKSIPVMAIIIYVILVIKSDWVAVVVCFLMCFPIAYTNILNGLEALDLKYLELGRNLGLTGKQMIRFIIRPSLDTQIRTALSLITAMSWKVVVASEVLAIPKYSIGYQMLNSKYYLETADLFAYIIVLIVLSLLMEKLVEKLAGLNMAGLGRSIGRAVQSHAAAGNEEGTARILLDQVTKTYLGEGGETHALTGFSAEFGPGVTALLGPSGAGKTTVARIIAELTEADGGEVKREGEPRVAYLFQEDRLLPWLKVRDNMMLGLISGGRSEGEAQDKIDAMAEDLEIRDALDMMPHELSGGMAHRAAMGRTLLYGGNVLILDEPFRGLDEELRDRIIERLSGELHPLKGERTVILITHDEDLADRLADRKIYI